MYHHHLQPPGPISKVKTNKKAVYSSAAPSVITQQQRRRKKRINYGTRTVEVRRGFNGFGFTISGQQPCRLSCIVGNSPADQSGLRVGDILISVNGLNVSKLSHETVVQLIGNSFGSIRMQIAEHYYSDSSDEENTLIGHQQYPNIDILKYSTLRTGCGEKSEINDKHSYLNCKAKLQRQRNWSQMKLNDASFSKVESETIPMVSLHSLTNNIDVLHEQNSEVIAKRSIVNHHLHCTSLVDDVPLGRALMSPIEQNFHKTTTKTMTSISTTTATLGCSSNVANVSAIVRVPNNALEYKVIVGYLGTIEMPQQISHSSKLQTVRTCIRKLRQEKRTPTTVLMVTLPDCLTLQASSGKVLAIYASSRLNYVSSSSESENRFFGLVTNTVYTTLPLGDDRDINDGQNQLSVSSNTGHIIISNSCHVFVVDTKLCEHHLHEMRAEEFHIKCTKDNLSGLCLEFPTNSEYVVNLIRNMYTMRILPSAAQYDINCTSTNTIPNESFKCNGQVIDTTAYSPQPSNQSEMSTTTSNSNSDSGIGFHNDCQNISDPVLVESSNRNRDPSLISEESDASLLNCPNLINICGLSEKDKLSVRAIIDSMSKIPLFNNSLRTTRTTRSCDDLNLTETHISGGKSLMKSVNQHLYTSIHDISTIDDKLVSEISVFSQKSIQHRKLQMKIESSIQTEKESINNVNKYSRKKKIFTNYQPKTTWSSLQELSERDNSARILKNVNSEQDLTRFEIEKSRDYSCNQRQACERLNWTQTSLRNPRSDKHMRIYLQKHFKIFKSPLLPRSISLINQITSMAHKNRDVQLRKKHLTSIKSNEVCISSTNNNTCTSNIVISWAVSFEQLLKDCNGLRAFAQFLKSEYSAENIYFWSACERYRHTSNAMERKQLAKLIFSKHLSKTATEPVNIDSSARIFTEEQLKYSADEKLFTIAQEQIFNLMKYDSYQRFIRSDLYKACRRSAENGEALPVSSTEDLDELLHMNKIDCSGINGFAKPQKSLSICEDARRKSLLLWNRKSRRKFRNMKYKLEKDYKSSMLKTQNSKKFHFNDLTYILNTARDLHSSRSSSVSSYDASTTDSKIHSACMNDINSLLCRVKFQDGSNTIVQIRVGETIKDMVERVLQKRGLNYQNYQVFKRSVMTKPLSLQLLCEQIAGKEIIIEQRISFKLDLTISKMIIVKSKPSKQLIDVIKPILHKYHYNLRDIDIVFKDTQEKVLLIQSVTLVDGQRLQIVIKKQECNLEKTPIKSNLHFSSTDVDLEITNSVFSDLMNRKLDIITKPNIGLVSDTKNEINSLLSDTCKSNTSFTYEGTDLKHMNTLKSKKEQLQDTSQVDYKKLSFEVPLETNKLPNVINLTLPSIYNLPQISFHKEILQEKQPDAMLEVLKRAQLFRLEDQRGTEINFELPDFLKNNKQLQVMNNININMKKTKPIEIHTPIIVDNLAEKPIINDKLRDNKFAENINIRKNSTSISPPPPLPPKPKIFPMRPSNWGSFSNFTTSKNSTNLHISKFYPLIQPVYYRLPSTIHITSAININSSNLKSAYLEEPSSSFV